MEDIVTIDTPLDPPFGALVARARALADAASDTRGRRILGIAGPPGAGKSTLARSLVSTVGEAAVYLPMDGYHLAQAELVRLGRADRKGAPDTFDWAGFVALLRRLRAVPDEVIYAPAFVRAIEEPIAGAIPIEPGHRLVVTEGNYLLLATPPWSGLRPLLDEAWYLDLDAAVRIERLIARHVRFGRSPDAAREWVMRSDEANAGLVAGTLVHADLVVREATPDAERFVGHVSPHPSRA
jgi:pantothenate kinase